MSDWWEQAACKGVPTNLFFPSRGEFTNPEIQEALSYCNRCPVRQECLNDALHHQDMHGICGGLSERQRRRIRSGYQFQQKRWCLECGRSFTATNRKQTHCTKDCARNGINRRARRTAS